MQLNFNVDRPVVIRQLNIITVIRQYFKLFCVITIQNQQFNRIKLIKHHFYSLSILSYVCKHTNQKYEDYKN